MEREGSQIEHNSQFKMGSNGKCGPYQQNCPIEGILNFRTFGFALSPLRLPRFPPKTCSPVFILSSSEDKTLRDSKSRCWLLIRSPRRGVLFPAPYVLTILRFSGIRGKCCHSATAADARPRPGGHRLTAVAPEQPR